MEEHRLCRRKEDFHLAVGGFAEGVNHPALCVDVAEADGGLGEVHGAEGAKLAPKRGKPLWRRPLATPRSRQPITLPPNGPRFSGGVVQLTSSAPPPPEMT